MGLSCKGGIERYVGRELGGVHEEFGAGGDGGVDGLDEDVVGEGEEGRGETFGFVGGCEDD